MLVFADAISEVRYERGLVSFRLSSSTSGLPGIVLHIPFADFREISLLLASEIPMIESVHNNWLQTQVVTDNRVPSEAHAGESESTTSKDAVGKKIATV